MGAVVGATARNKGVTQRKSAKYYHFLLAISASNAIIKEWQIDSKSANIQLSHEEKHHGNQEDHC